jgi:hypothetical protein
MGHPRRHHYVWRHYLEAWEDTGNIAVLRKDTGNTFSTNPKNVAVMRDFYRHPRINPDDELFIRKFIDEMPSPDHLKKLNRGWLGPISFLSRARTLSQKAGPLARHLDAMLDKLEITIEERFHSRIEGDAQSLISDLRSGSIDF